MLFLFGRYRLSSVQIFFSTLSTLIWRRVHDSLNVSIRLIFLFKQILLLVRLSNLFRNKNSTENLRNSFVSQPNNDDDLEGNCEGWRRSAWRLTCEHRMRDENDRANKIFSSFFVISNRLFICLHLKCTCRFYRGPRAHNVRESLRKIQNSHQKIQKNHRQQLRKFFFQHFQFISPQNAFKIRRTFSVFLNIVSQAAKIQRNNLASWSEIKSKIFSWKIYLSFVVIEKQDGKFEKYLEYFRSEIHPHRETQLT